MTMGATFDSTKTPLHELLGRADNGKLQDDEGPEEWDTEEPLEEAVS